jgi:hypothetical protein
MFTIVSRDYGRWTNQLKVTLTRDAAADATLVLSDASSYLPATVKVSNPADNQVFSYRIRNGLKVTCPAGGLLNVTSLQEVTLTQAGNIIGAVSWDLIPTLSDLAAWIGRFPGWSATVVGPGYIPACCLAFISAGAPGITTFFHPAEEGLLAWLLWSSDPLVEPNPTAVYVAPVVVSGIMRLPTPKILNWNPSLYAAMFSDGMPGLLPIPTTAGGSFVTALTGGAGSQWDNLATDTLGIEQALMLAEQTPAAYIWVQSVNPNVQNLVLQHAMAMSDVLREKYRIFIGGINFLSTSPNDGATLPASSVDAAVDAAAERAPQLDGPCVLCMNGPIYPNPTTGQPEQLGGLGLAAQILGMASGMAPNQPLTNKPVICQGLEFPMLLDSHVDKLLVAGVLVPEFVREDGTYNVIHALTTRQTNDPTDRLFHGLRIKHTINRLWLSVLSKYKGKPLDMETGERIKLTCATALDGQIMSGTNTNGILTRGKKDGKELPAWKDLVVSGDTSTGLWTIDCQVFPVGESDYILVRTKLLPQTIQL